MKKFMEAQGYNVNVYLYQDNTSAIQLENNGKASSSKRTRHLDIRYFFIKDQVDKQQLNIKYCPTDQMPADYQSKPLQGDLFQKQKEIFMGNSSQKWFFKVFQRRTQPKIDRAQTDERAGNVKNYQYQVY